MAYDPKLDASSFKELVEISDKTRISISVWSYNGGIKRLQLSRENMVDGEWNFTKLGRMSKPEIEAVLPIIIQAVEVM
jgi:hypothetical protein